jgi:plasmid maintenance system antidote protein VapI
MLNGRRAITTTTAMLIEAALDIPADSLMKLQLKYNMYQAQNDHSFMERLKQVRRYVAML